MKNRIESLYKEQCGQYLVGSLIQISEMIMEQFQDKNCNPDGESEFDKLCKSHPEVEPKEILEIVEKQIRNMTIEAMASFQR